MGATSIWVLADPHGGSDPAADRALADFLARAAERRVELLILGDLFLGWIAIDRFLTPFQREVIDRLRELRARGGRVDFVAGNRDYLARELVGSAFDRVLEGEEVIALGGVPTLVTHGDLLNRSDTFYRAWHAVSRSRAATFFMTHLPAAAGRALAEKTELALRDTNMSYKSGDLPIPSLLELGKRASDRGARRALVGHFHHDRTLDVVDGVPVIVAPGFVEHRRVLAVEPETGALRSRDATNVD